MAKKFIFRWKDNNIKVTPSLRRTKEAVWTFAITKLCPAGMSRSEGKEFLKKHGGIVEVE